MNIRMYVANYEYNMVHNGSSLDPSIHVVTH